MWAFASMIILWVEDVYIYLHLWGMEMAGYVALQISGRRNIVRGCLYLHSELSYGAIYHGHCGPLDVSHEDTRVPVG